MRVKIATTDGHETVVKMSQALFTDMAENIHRADAGRGPVIGALEVGSGLAVYFVPAHITRFVVISEEEQA